MKAVSLHPFSVLVGLALAGLVAISMGAAQSVQQIPTRTKLVGFVPAEWWTFVAIDSSSPTPSYTVPADRYLVVTLADLKSGVLLADGEQVSDRLSVVSAVYGRIERPARVSFPPGTLFAFGPIGGSAQLWGYLEPVP